MSLVARHMLRRNPVWMVPLGLPFVLATGSDPLYGVFVSLVTLVVIPLVHVVSLPLERWLPRQLRLLPVLITAATTITIVELALTASGVGLHPRSLLLLRALSVAPITTWPTVVSPRNEPYLHRLSVATGLGIGFALGYIPVALARLGLAALGYGFADTVFVGFLILGTGRLLINVLEQAAVSGTGGAAEAGEVGEP